MFFKKAILGITGVSLLSLAACGGSGGGDGASDVQFSGMVSSSEQSQTARALEMVEVCALGSCSETNAEGLWSFAVPRSVFNGGEVLFTLSSGAGVAEVLTPRIETGVSNVVVDFEVASDGNATLAAFSEDGVVEDDFTIGDGEDVDDGELPQDPSQRACAVISRTNIVITDINEEIQVTNAPESCPGEIPFFLAVANPSGIAFDYEVTVDFGGVMPLTSTGSLAPGEIDEIPGVYDCSDLESYATVVNATITNYYPGEGVDPISRDQALAECGANASVGNTVDSADILVEVQ